jgi:hypothetical protein
MRRDSIRFAGGALLASLTASVSAQPQRLVVPLSNPARPAILDVRMLQGSITVNAYEGNDVVIVVDEGHRGSAARGASRMRARETGAQRAEREAPPGSGAQPATRPDLQGLHRIPNTSIGVTAEEHDNDVSVSVDYGKDDVDLEISVPRLTSVHAATVNGGDLTIKGVTGDHELSNVNGDISAMDVAGSAVVQTTNGDIRMSFAEIARDKAMSFSSFNGDIDVSFPASLAADLDISTRGDILTDFDVGVTPRAPVVDQGGNAGRYRVSLQGGVHGVVGGGGPEIQFRTFNGDVVIRKR